MNLKLREARKARCWSQAEVAEKAQVDVQTYARWEKGKQQPHPHNQHLLCKAFNMSAEQLGLREYPNPVQIPLQIPSRQLLTPPTEATDSTFYTWIRALLLTQQQYGWTFDELCFMTGQEMRKLHTMTQQQSGKDKSRRDAVKEILSFLVGLPIAVTGLTTIGNLAAFPAEEMLPLYITSIPACWRLFFEGELSEVERVLGSYLANLTMLVQRDSKHQQVAASLASQAHQLNALLVLQREDFGSSLAQAKQALQYGQLAGDPNLQASSAIRQVDTLFHRNTLLQHNTFLRHKNYLQILGVLQEAEQYINAISPLLRGRIFSELGVAYANVGRQKEAERYIGLAYDTYPDHPEDDPGFLYTHTNHYILYIDDMLARLSLNQPKDAWQAIMKASAFVPNVISPRRMELLDYCVIGSIALDDLDSSCAYFKELALSGIQLGSELHNGEVQTIYQQLYSKWPHEKRIQELAELLTV
jgi:transcriptional regulator with XRE-family HTH domain/tetratricopeptide (TPR) repeat protein